MRQRFPPLHAALESERATMTLTKGSLLPKGLTGAIDLAAAGVAAVFALATFAAAGALVAGFFEAAVVGFAVFAAVAVDALAVVVLAVALAVFTGAICEAGFVPVLAVGVAGLAAGVKGLAAGFAIVPWAHALAAASTRTEIVFVAFIKLPLTSPVSRSWPVSPLEQVRHD